MTPGLLSLHMRRLTIGTERCGRGALRVTALLTLLSALLVAPATANAAIDGKLKQLALPNGCLDNAEAQGCKNITAPMQNPGEPAISADGRHVYVPARDSDSLNWFDRNPTTGVLTERGCIRSSTAGAATGCTLVTAAPIEDATGAAVSADGKSLYVVGGTAGGSAPDGIVTFSLQSDGTPVFDQCFTGAASTGCVVTTGFSNPATVAVSPNGASVYVASLNSGAIAVFQRNTTTGSLNQATLGTDQRCIKGVADGEGCTVVPQLLAPRDIEVTPDGKSVVVGNINCTTIQNCYSMLALDRNTSTGVLTAQPAPEGCISHFGPSGGCALRSRSSLPIRSRSPTTRSNCSTRCEPAGTCGCRPSTAISARERSRRVVAVPRPQAAHRTARRRARHWRDFTTLRSRRTTSTSIRRATRASASASSDATQTEPSRSGRTSSAASPRRIRATAAVV